MAIWAATCHTKFFTLLPLLMAIMLRQLYPFPQTTVWIYRCLAQWIRLKDRHRCSTATTLTRSSLFKAVMQTTVNSFECTKARLVYYFDWSVQDLSLYVLFICLFPGGCKIWLGVYVRQPCAIAIAFQNHNVQKENSDKLNRVALRIWLGMMVCFQDWDTK